MFLKRNKYFIALLLWMLFLFNGMVIAATSSVPLIKVSAPSSVTTSYVSIDIKVSSQNYLKYLYVGTQKFTLPKKKVFPVRWV